MTTLEISSKLHKVGPFNNSFMLMLQGWVNTRRKYSQKITDSTIGSDYVTGEAWLKIGLNLRELLSTVVADGVNAGEADSLIVKLILSEFPNHVF